MAFSPKLITRLKWGLGLFIGFTLFFTIFGHRGLLKIYRIKKEIWKLEASISNLTVQNKILSNNILRMQTEHSFQERSVRETLGMVKENEMIYEFTSEVPSQ